MVSFVLLMRVLQIVTMHSALIGHLIRVSIRDSRLCTCNWPDSLVQHHWLMFA